MPFSKQITIDPYDAIRVRSGIPVALVLNTGLPISIIPVGRKFPSLSQGEGKWEFGCTQQPAQMRK